MNDSEKISLLDKSIMLAIYPMLGYFLICMYEVGYITTFHIPIEFININISNFINIIPNIFLKIIFISIVWTTIEHIIHITDLENPIFFKAYEVFKICFCFLVIAIFSYEVIENIKSVLLATIIIYAVIFLWPLITQYKIKGLRNRVLKQMNESDELYEKTLKWYHTKKIGLINIKMILFFIFLSVIMLVAGNTEAMVKTNYYKLNNNVVIRIYNDVIICCEYDSKSKKIDDSSFKVLQKNNIDNLKFEEIVLNSKASEIKK